ncbi:MAG TPA: lysine--tRNA ligase [Acidimicrobiales bacterium]|nr:lysine--tRNA ligase [Acidimicrobiales bacterium]
MSPTPPYRFDQTHLAADVVSTFGSLEPGAESGQSVSVAGRVMLHRHQGKLDFAEMRDSSGALQLFAGAGWTSDFDGFTALSLGDWVGATGEVVRTRRGELSVKVADWVLLAESRRGFGDKWKGITDIDTRYRQREVDLWANEDSRRRLLDRSRLISETRRFLEERRFIEVDTPTFHPVVGGADARPFVTHHNSLDVDLYLRIELEIYLKRLVVGGLERVFEIGRVFRNEGLSPRHNPEFTMLELYQAYADYTDMMAISEELVAHLAKELTGGTVVEYGGRPVNLTPPWRRATMAELIEEAIGRPADLSCDLEDLRRVAAEHEVPIEARWGPGKLMLEIYEKTTEANIWDPVFVCDYPQEVSPLARVHRTRPGYVERFEAVVVGRELCNAFSELTDPDDQRTRFEAQVQEKLAAGNPDVRVDEDYLRALENGLPPTGGLGMGIDRLVMLLTGAQSISDVIAFPTLRPESGRP